MDIRKIVIWLVIITVVSFAVAGISFGSYFSSGAWKAQRTTFTDEKVLDIKDISKINIKSPSSGVRIVATDDKQVKATFEVTHLGNASSTPTLKVEAVNGEINIEIVDHPGIGFTSVIDKLEIAIPASYNQDLAIEVLSGSTTISNIKLAKLNYKGSSGGFRAEDVAAKSANISVMSGSIRMAGFTGDLQVENSSGQIDVEYKEYKNNTINIKGMSGSIQLKLPAEAQFNLDANTMSGSVNCDFPITIQGGSSKSRLQGQVGKEGGTVKLNISSGSININK